MRLSGSDSLDQSRQKHAFIGNDKIRRTGLSRVTVCMSVMIPSVTVRVAGHCSAPFPRMAWRAMTLEIVVEELLSGTATFC